MLRPVEVEAIDERRIMVNGTVYEVREYYKPFPTTRPYFLLIETNEERYFAAEDYRKYGEVIRKAVERKYFIPRVEKILKIDTRGDEFVWEVKTDRGETTFKTRGRSRHFQA